jgi:hypothetical protein
VLGLWDQRGESREARGEVGADGLKNYFCSKTTLTGESRFHISTPPGIEPGSLMTGSKRGTTGLVELCMNVVRLQAIHRAPPQQPTMSVVKLEGGPATSMKPGQKSCMRSCGIITLSARRPSDGSGRSLPQMRPQ